MIAEKIQKITKKKVGNRREGKLVVDSLVLLIKQRCFIA